MKDMIINILRYIFTIPLALIGAIIGSTLAPYLFVAYIPVNSIAYSIFWYLSSNIFFVLIPMYVFYTLPPKKHLKILATLSILYCIFWILTIILEIIAKTFSWERLFNAVIQIITIITYLLSLPEEEIKEN